MDVCVCVRVCVCETDNKSWIIAPWLSAHTNVWPAPRRGGVKLCHKKHSWRRPPPSVCVSASNGHSLLFVRNEVTLIICLLSCRELSYRRLWSRARTLARTHTHTHTHTHAAIQQQWRWILMLLLDSVHECTAALNSPLWPVCVPPFPQPYKACLPPSVG